MKTKILIAGIAGASLGTELLKALSLAGKYEIYGADISETAYGLYDCGFTETFIADNNNYIQSIIGICQKRKIDLILPGGEIPMNILSKNNDKLAKYGIKYIGNDINIVNTFSDKNKTFEILKECGFTIPVTVLGNSKENIANVGLPCIIKPSTGTGGSVLCFSASTLEEAWSYCQLISNSGKTPIVQEYISASEGEFTVGVLSFTDGEIAGSIAMKRNLDAKLSVVFKKNDIVISGGYSQGYIDDFSDIRKQCENIAKIVGSRGPLNIQGRLKNGEFVPFEINPRFSASTYLRAMAGFNEVDIYLNNILNGKKIYFNAPKKGWYLRSFQEQFVEKLKSGVKL
jgi:carbamoyl-phosphate synthase large subunit